MKKKKTQTPAPEPVDFYTEALKAFDAPLPPSEEMIRAQQQVQQEKIAKKRRLYQYLTAAVLVFTLVLVLWQPWNPAEPPTTGGDVTDTVPQPGQMVLPESITFYLEPIPGNPAISYQPTLQPLKLDAAQGNILMEKINGLKWSPMALLSYIPPATVGGFYLKSENLDLNIGGEEYTTTQSQYYSFDATGTLFHNGYMAQADQELWSMLMELMHAASQQVPSGDYSASLADGGWVRLGIGSEGSFNLVTEVLDISGSCARINEFLALGIVTEHKFGLLVFRIDGDELRFSAAHSTAGLVELEDETVFSVQMDVDSTMVSALIGLRLPDEENPTCAPRDLTMETLYDMSNILYKIEWVTSDASIPESSFIGFVKLTLNAGGQAQEKVEIRFTETGFLKTDGKFARLEGEAWSEFVALLYDIVGPMALSDAYHVNNSTALYFEGNRFSLVLPDTDPIKGSVLCIGDNLLLAGDNGFTMTLRRDRDRGTLTDRDGMVYYKGGLYGDA